MSITVQISHTIPVIREIEARTKVERVRQNDDKSLVETADGERFWIYSDYVKEIK